MTQHPAPTEQPTTSSARPARRLARAALTVGLALSATVSMIGTAAAADDEGTGTPLVSSAGAPRSAYTGDELQITESFATSVIQLADQDWTTWFTSNGFQEPRVGYEMVESGDTFVSNCTLNGRQMVVTTDTPNAFFCSADTVTEGFSGTLVVPVTALRRIWDGDLYNRQVKDSGDFTVATIIAHEFGHHVVDELVAQGAYWREPATEKNKELIADCFAGNWVASAYGHGYLAADPERYIAQSVAAMENLGDYNVSSPLHHGTPEERSNAVRIGIYGTQQNPLPAEPQNCIDTYWD